MSSEVDAPAQIPGAEDKKPQPKKRSFIGVAIVLVGMLILLYPVLSTVWNNYTAKKAAEEYSRLIDQTDPAELKAHYDRAVEYNSTRPPVQIVDPWNNPDTHTDPGYGEYESQLALYDAMARLRIPSIDVDMPVFHGTSDDVIRRGVGHLYGTDLPVGGEGTHTALTSHSGMQDQTLFDNLEQLEVGESIYVDVYGQTLRYQVYDTQVVLPEDVEGLDQQESRDLMTLITCTPYGVNSHRLLVHAERAPYNPAEDGETGWRLPGQWWMWVFGAIALSGLIYSVRMTRASKKRAEGAETAADAQDVEA